MNKKKIEKIFEGFESILYDPMSTMANWEGLVKEQDQSFIANILGTQGRPAYENQKLIKEAVMYLVRDYFKDKL